MKNIDNDAPPGSARIDKVLSTLSPRALKVSPLPVFNKDILSSNPDLVCFSHLRWNFVFQRPQHLLSRFALERRVFFVEEPVIEGMVDGTLEIKTSREGVTILTPRIRRGLSEEEVNGKIRILLDQYLPTALSSEYIFWYYTPMMLPLSRHYKPKAVIYDCMDELSKFAGAHPSLVRREHELLRRADVVFTGGQSLYEAKKSQHSNIHPMPSSIDREHFGKARQQLPDPEDQASIARPRIGFFGVIDERLDIDLIRAVAEARPDYQFVMIGPVVKISESVLPRLANIHYLGGKSYSDLPAYLSNWDAAVLPMALNEATKFISPTKTPEYLAGGIPVVSTPITDVVTPYGAQNLVSIAGNPDEFCEMLDLALRQKEDRLWLERVDRYLSGISWQKTWSKMSELVGGCLDSKRLQSA